MHEYTCAGDRAVWPLPVPHHRLTERKGAAAVVPGRAVLKSGPGLKLNFKEYETVE